MKKRLIFILLLVAGSFCFAETLDGLYGVKFGLQKDEALKQFEAKGWEISETNNGYCNLANSEPKTYGGIKVSEISVFWDDLDQVYLFAVTFVENGEAGNDIFGLKQAMSKKFNLTRCKNEEILDDWAYTDGKVEIFSADSLDAFFIENIKLKNEMDARKKELMLLIHSGDDF